MDIRTKNTSDNDKHNSILGIFLLKGEAPQEGKYVEQGPAVGPLCWLVFAKDGALRIFMKILMRKPFCFPFSCARIGKE
jgi:hypothetical protein